MLKTMLRTILKIRLKTTLKVLQKKTRLTLQFISAVFFIFVFATSSVSASASAQSLDEADILKRLLQEIEAVNPLIAEAQRQSDHQSRLRFNYSCLLADINLIKQGIRSAVYEIKQQSESDQTLCGDYGFTGQLGGEAQRLFMLQTEFQSLNPIINEAQQKANSSLRAHLNYPALKADIDTLISGIQHALLGAGDQPRRLPALRGSFVQ